MKPITPEAANSQEDLDILADTQKRIFSWYSYFGNNIDIGRQHTYFLFLNQWTPSELEDLRRLKKPILTFNKLYDYYKKICGIQRQNTPRMEVISINDAMTDPSEAIATQQLLDIRGGLLRHIEYESHSDIVYQTAFANACARGYGAIRIYTDYESADSFNQVIRLQAVINPDQCYWDPMAIDTTKQDGDYCGMYVMMAREKFESEYPDIPYPVGFTNYGEISYFTWIGKDTVTIVEEYRKEYYEKTIYLLDTNEVVDKDDYDALMKSFSDANITHIRPPQIIDKRISRDYKIWRYKLVADRVLEKSLWPSKELPIVFVDGDSYWYEGQQRTQSFIRHAIDSQRFLNYLGVDIAQAARTRRRELIMATPSNMAGFERYYKNPELQQGALPYNPDSITQQPPIRSEGGSIPMDLLQQYMRAGNDIQEILGVYDANLGAPSNEVSGVAINARVKQGNTATYVYVDNLARAIEQIGRTILDLIPKIYDNERTLSLKSAQGETRQYQINQLLPNGMIKNDMTTGRFAIEMTSAPPYEVQKQAALATLTTMLQAMPQAMPLVADIIADNLDIPNRDLLIERFKTLVPASILAKEAGKPAPPPQPNPQAQMAQMEFQVKMGELQNKMKETSNKSAEIQMEMQRLQQEGQLQPMELALDQAKQQAEIHKANMSYSSDVVNALAKHVGAHHAMNRYQDRARQA